MSQEIRSRPQENVKPKPIASIYEKIIGSLTILLFLVLPVQKKNHRFFEDLSRQLIPSDLNLPEFFSKRIDYYLTDFLLIAIICVFALYRKTTLKNLLWDGPVKYLSLFFIIALASILHSVSAGYVLQYYRLAQLLLAFLFFSAIASSTQIFSKPALLKKIFWAVLFGALFESGVGILQYFTQSPIGLGYLGELKQISIFKFAMPEGKKWIFGMARENGYVFRACGTFTNPNILGGFLFFSLIANFYLFYRENNRWTRVFLQLALFLQTVALTITYSRAALFATLICSSLWFAVSIYTFSKNSSFSALDYMEKTLFAKRIRILMVSFAASLALCFILFFPQVQNRGGIINYNTFVSSSDAGRIAYQKVSWEMTKEHPLLGVGYNNFQLHLKDLTPSDYSKPLYSKVHNIYLLVLSEMGICGLMVFLLFLISILRTAVRREWTMANLTLFAIFAGFLLIGGCDFYFLETSLGKILFFGIAGLLYANGKGVLAHKRIPLYAKT
ncbi:MAG: O-antigen ligase family protein [Verrucomicrobia bacterium]|nr:O-antigen ligase family protein [Verrucomicrobiota bacterium]